ncbi:MAG: type II toxin-antitoxin system YafQ family toxin [Isosphaeraceae bacterium]
MQQDHFLAGDWKGWRDCHVEPDWVLIHKKEGGKLILGETGIHSDLFGN